MMRKLAKSFLLVSCVWVAGTDVQGQGDANAGKISAAPADFIISNARVHTPDGKTDDIDMFVDNVDTLIQSGAIVRV